MGEPVRMSAALGAAACASDAALSSALAAVAAGGEAPAVGAGPAADAAGAESDTMVPVMLDMVHVYTEAELLELPPAMRERIRAAKGGDNTADASVAHARMEMLRLVVGELEIAIGWSGRGTRHRPWSWRRRRQRRTFSKVARSSYRRCAAPPARVLWCTLTCNADASRRPGWASRARPSRCRAACG